MIQQPIPYFVGQFAKFEDTLAVDDPTEALTLTKPDGTDASVAHTGLTRVVNDGSNPDYPAGSVTYSVQIQLDQSGAWKGKFTATTSDAGTAPIQAYVAL